MKNMQKMFSLRLIALFSLFTFSFSSVANAASPVYSLNVSRDLGKVAQRYKGAGRDGKTVVIVQDAHSSLMAQSNIAEMLCSLLASFDAIVEQPSLDKGLPFIGLEGAVGEYDFEDLRKYPLREAKKVVASDYVKDGYLVGAEMASIISDVPLLLVGLENKDVFIDNFKIFNRVLKKRSDIDSELAFLDNQICTLKKKMFNANLQEFDANAEKFETGKIHFSEYLPLLDVSLDVDTGEYVYFNQLKEILIEESFINNDMLRKDFFAALEALTSLDISLADKNLLASFSQANFFKANLIYDENVSILADVALRNNFSFDKYPAISKVLILKRRFALIDISKMLEEINSLNDVIRLFYAKSENERIVLSLSKKVRLLKKLCFLNACRREVKYFRSNISEFYVQFIVEQISKIKKNVGFSDFQKGKIKSVWSIDSLLSDVNLFYTTAEKRDVVLIDNLLDNMKRKNQNIGILVAGGYHTDGMIAHLVKKGIDYVVVTPNVDSSKQDVAYIDRMLGNIVPIKQFSGAMVPSSCINASITGLLMSDLLAPEIKEKVLRELQDDMRKDIKAQSLFSSERFFINSEKVKKVVEILKASQYLTLANALENIASEINDGSVIGEIAEGYTKGESLELLSDKLFKAVRRRVGDAIEDEESFDVYLYHARKAFTDFLKDYKKNDTFQQKEMVENNGLILAIVNFFKAFIAQAVNVFAFLLKGFLFVLMSYTVVFMNNPEKSYSFERSALNEKAPNSLDLNLKSSDYYKELAEIHSFVMSNSELKSMETTIKSLEAGLLRDVLTSNYVQSVIEYVNDNASHWLGGLYDYFFNYIVLDADMDYVVSGNISTAKEFLRIKEKYNEMIVSTQVRSLDSLNEPQYMGFYQYDSTFPLDSATYQDAFGLQVRSGEKIIDRNSTYFEQRPRISFSVVPFRSISVGPNWKPFDFNMNDFDFVGSAEEKFSPYNWDVVGDYGEPAGYYTNIWLGHKAYQENGAIDPMPLVVETWPVLSIINASGTYFRLKGKDGEFGSTCRTLISFAPNNPESEVFPNNYDIAVAVPSDNISSVVRQISHPSYEAIAQDTLVLDSGSSTVVNTEIAGAIRQGVLDVPGIGFGASSMFWVDGAHDADTVRIRGANGSVSNSFSLVNPQDGPLVVELGSLEFGGSFSVLQLERNEDAYSYKPGVPYSERTNLFFTLESAYVFDNAGNAIPFQPIVKAYVFPTVDETVDNVVVWADIPKDIRLKMGDKSFFIYNYTTTATKASELPGNLKPVVFSDVERVKQNLLSSRWGVENTSKFDIGVDVGGNIIIDCGLLSNYAGVEIDARDIPIYNNIFKDENIIRVDLWTDNGFDQNLELEIKPNDIDADAFRVTSGTTYFKTFDDLESLTIAMLKESFPANTGKIWLRISYGSPNAPIDAVPVVNRVLEPSWNSGGRIPVLREWLLKRGWDRWQEDFEQLLFVPGSLLMASFFGYSGVCLAGLMFFLLHLLPSSKVDTPPLWQVGVISLSNVLFVSAGFWLLDASFSLLLKNVFFLGVVLFVLTDFAHKWLNRFFDSWNKIKDVEVVELLEDDELFSVFNDLRDKYLKEYKVLLREGLSEFEMYTGVDKLLVVDNHFSDDEFLMMQYHAGVIGVKVLRLIDFNSELYKDVDLFYFSTQSEIPPEIQNSLNLKASRTVDFEDKTQRSFYIYFVFDVVLQEMLVKHYCNIDETSKVKKDFLIKFFKEYSASNLEAVVGKFVINVKHRLFTTSA